MNNVKTLTFENLLIFNKYYGKIYYTGKYGDFLKFQAFFGKKYICRGAFVKKTINALYVINIMSQAIFDLAVPIGLGLLCSWLLSTYASVGTWIYAFLIPLGALVGLYSMIKFVLSAMAALERLEREQNEK